MHCVESVERSHRLGVSWVKGVRVQEYRYLAHKEPPPPYDPTVSLRWSWEGGAAPYAAHYERSSIVECPKNWVFRLQFSNDGAQAISGSVDETVRGVLLSALPML